MEPYDEGYMDGYMDASREHRRALSERLELLRADRDRAIERAVEAEHIRDEMLNAVDTALGVPQ